MTDTLFETAARLKYRFPSIRGDLTVEQLFDLPLLHPSTADLDSVARAINKELKGLTSESFVEVVTEAAKRATTALSDKLEIVKYVIKVKQDEAKAVETARLKKAERQKILDIINAKKDAALSEASMEELEKRLAALSA